MRKFVFKIKKMIDKRLERITFNPQIMGGKACIRGMRVTAGAIVAMVSTGHSFEDILIAYPYLELDDIKQSLQYAAWRVQEIEVPVNMAA